MNVVLSLIMNDAHFTCLLKILCCYNKSAMVPDSIFEGVQNIYKLFVKQEKTRVFYIF